MKKLNKIGAVLLAVFLAGMFIYISMNRVKLANQGRYTICTTQGSDGKFVKYSFDVMGKAYGGKYPRLKHDPDENGGKYFVKFLPSDPDVIEIFWNRNFPNCLGDLPRNGWQKIPRCK